MKFSRSIRLSTAGLAAIAVLSGCGDSGNLVAPSQLDTTPPPAPQNLTVSDNASGYPVLNWTDSPATDLASYQVYVYAPVAGGGNDFVAAGSVVDNSFLLPIVSTTVQASYRVRAVDTSGNGSAFSATASILISPSSAPGGGQGGTQDPPSSELE
ncbi:MAG: hypothetical protein ACRENJ_05165 [Candidatus Eiseniibacteriota bacterium]